MKTIKKILTFLWKGIVGLSIVLSIWVAALAIYEHYMPNKRTIIITTIFTVFIALLFTIVISFRPVWNYYKYLPTKMDGKITIKHLLYLVRTIEKIVEWLSLTDKPLIIDLCHEMVRIRCKVLNEILPYRALESKDEDVICAALRDLSQIEGKDNIQRGISFIRSNYIDPPLKQIPKRIKMVAEAVIKELEELSKLDEKKKRRECQG